MAERPLLILPEPTTAARATKRGGGSGPAPLGRARQQQRLGPRLDEIEAAFEAKRLTLQTTAVGLLPEDVLVLETAGPVENFFRAAAKVEGLEFLAEYDEDDIPPDDDFFVERNGVHLSPSVARSTSNGSFLKPVATSARRPWLAPAAHHC